MSFQKINKPGVWSKTLDLINLWSLKGFDKMLSAANDAADAVHNVHGRRFAVGKAAEIRHPTTGSTLDWFSDFIGVPYAFEIQVISNEHFCVSF